MELEYRGRLSQQDYLRCLKITANRQYKWQKRVFGILLILSIISFAIILLPFNGTSMIEPSDLSNYVSCLIPLAIFLFPWWLPYVQLSSFNQPTNIYRNEVYGTVNEKEISINNEEVKVSFQWSLYEEYIRDGDLALLFQGKNAFNAFKQEMFKNVDDWEAFISFAENHIS